MIDPNEITIATPVRPLRPPYNMTEEKIHRLGRARKDIDTGTTPLAPASTGTPLQVSGVLATESPVKRQDRTYSLVSVQFLRSSNDPAFSGVRIWLTNYQGSATPVIVAQGNESPVSFLCETTGEKVVVTVQAFGGTNQYAPFDKCPTAVTSLDGVVSAPPAPTIHQYLVAISFGLQFQFNYLAGLASDIVDGYWVYRNSANDSTTASRYKYVKHSPLNSGAYTFQDVVGSGQTYYYWVSAVNTQGFESTLVDCQSGSVASVGTSTTYFRRPTTSTGAWVNRANAYDANNATSSSGAASSTTTVSVWSGFAAAPAGPTAMTLKIIWDNHPNTVGTDGLTVEYSLNGGVGWTNWFTNTAITGTTTNTFALGLAQDLTQVQVRATVTDVAGGGSDADIFEIWIEVIAP